MKSPDFPEFVDPTKYCDKQLTIHGSIPIEKLPRFAERQADKAGRDAALAPVDAKAEFHRDEQGTRLAQLEYSTLAVLTCERCLGDVDYPVEGSATFAFLPEGFDLQTVPESYEPVLMDSNEVNLLQALEDELLLSLPMFAYHQDEQCNSRLNEMNESVEDQSKVSPFAVLGDLLKK